MDKEIKFCPYLPQKEERKACFVGNGDITVTYFLPCLGEECAAYHSGKCTYGGVNIDVFKAGEENG